MEKGQLFVRFIDHTTEEMNLIELRGSVVDSARVSGM